MRKVKDKNTTKEMREKTKQLVGDYFKGKYTQEELYEQLKETLQPLLASLTREFVEKFTGHLQEDDIEITLLEGLWMTIIRLSSDFQNPFSFIRKSLKGHLLDLGKTLAYASKAQNGQALERAEVEQNDELLVDDDEDLDGWEVVDERVDVETEVIVRDFVRKLPPLERKVISLLMDGYTLQEVSRLTGLSPQKVSEIVEKVRSLWEQE